MTSGLTRDLCLSVCVHRARNTESVCINLQSQILNCYKENREQTLQCSDLAKTYMQCIDAAKKVSVHYRL
ncbi:unnamed protein product [Oncorhynchus mykiss]|uniref:CHCH domain-containing protein n=1 Tax=Oncorhynchus mykiss TaxID=8022 RepID=A0A060XYC8_ONCMY|nr:unnamed protein product [Oncorhynchus mykiss]